MRKSILFILFLLPLFGVYAQKIEVAGGQKDVILYSIPTSSGLDGVYVMYGLDNAKLTYNSTTGNSLKWYKYTNNINAKSLVKEGETITSTLDALENNTGYQLVDGTETHVVWIIDYKQYECTSIEVSAINDAPCDELHLTAKAPLFEMGYNEAVFPSSRKTLDIQLALKYRTMEFSEPSKAYISKDVTRLITSLTSDLLVSEAPLMNTTFTLGNDIFSSQWGLNKDVTSLEYTAVAVNATVLAKHTARDADNELEKEVGELGGSAPVDVIFNAYANEPTATYYTWQIATDDKFKHVVATFSDKEVRYTFTEAQTYFARLTVSNSNNSCVDSSQVKMIEVTISDLKVPNAFSPNDDGKNDLFLVAYKSIVKFNGLIFNRWGNQLFTWSDPAKGWDGKVGGKFVTPGAYYYVIEAVGSDGKKYNLKGDINVFSSK
ncbi:MAG: gliding motility-associated C-terminal domain-containing protein [Bacteroidales bacterium]|nr:gliding motility-associated C-terminal domain-containing protein [Bacteroidales bacterium]